MKYFLFFCLIFYGCKVADLSQNKINIYTVGDSTMANKPLENNNPERGWVQMLAPFFNENVAIFNHAVNGRSSKSFRDLGHWQPVLNQLKKGDYVLIQFGHNDSKDTDPVRYTNPQTSYRYNLITYINEVRDKGATPILLSSIARRKFNDQGVLLDAHGNYTLVARLVAQEFNVEFIDMQYLTEQLFLKYGVESSKKLVLNFEPGEHPYFPEGKTDNTHLTEFGATEIAKLFVDEMVKKNHPISKFLRM
ncbi:MAG: rhamnogalacturonan acetylesterase [Flavobacterium sp.]